MLDKGVWAEVKVGNEHLRLFAEHNAQGVQASVYNVISKTWIAASQNRWRILSRERASGSSCAGIPQASGEHGITGPPVEGVTLGLGCMV
jgi:hypothetical protein